MFASRNHNQTKQPEGRRQKGSDSTPDRRTAPQLNPLWQSLAMGSGVVQAKLTIGQADDPYEREADRVADQVMRMPAPPSSGQGLSITPVTAHQAQRQCAKCEEEEEGVLQRKESGSAETPSTAPPIVHQTLSSPGQPLDATTRAYFEPRYGRDFGRVRVHTGNRATESARSINARAYTLGHDIVFSAGQYMPGTTAGQRLLSHELTHVVQQLDSTVTPSIRRSEGIRENRTVPPFPSDQVDDYEFVSFVGKNLWLRIQHAWTWIEADPGIASGWLNEILDLLRSSFGRAGTAETMLDWLIEQIEYVLDAQLLLAGYEDPVLNSIFAAIAGTFRDLDPALAAVEGESAASISEVLIRSIKYMPGAIGEGFIRIVTDRIFLGSLAVAVGVYLALWLVPEPVFTKLAAAATTLAILSTGAFSISTIYNLAQAWMDLEADVGAAQSDEEIERAAERFGKRIGAIEADLLVFLASLLVGGMIPGPKRLPPVGKALADAERSLAGAQSGGVLIGGPFFRVRAVPPSGKPIPVPARGSALALKVEPVAEAIPLPAEAIPFRVPKPQPLPAAGPSPATGNLPMPVVPVVPGIGVKPDPDDAPDNARKRCCCRVDNLQVLYGGRVPEEGTLMGHIINAHIMLSHVEMPAGEEMAGGECSLEWEERWKQSHPTAGRPKDLTLVYNTETHISFPEWRSRPRASTTCPWTGTIIDTDDPRAARSEVEDFGRYRRTIHFRIAARSAPGCGASPAAVEAEQQLVLRDGNPVWVEDLGPSVGPVQMSYFKIGGVLQDNELPEDNQIAE